VFAGEGSQEAPLPLQHPPQQPLHKYLSHARMIPKGGMTPMGRFSTVPSMVSVFASFLATVVRTSGRRRMRLVLTGSH
jgi:predicted acyltransferase